MLKYLLFFFFIMSNIVFSQVYPKPEIYTHKRVDYPIKSGFLELRLNIAKVSYINAIFLNYNVDNELITVMSLEDNSLLTFKLAFLSVSSLVSKINLPQKNISVFLEALSSEVNTSLSNSIIKVYYNKKTSDCFIFPENAIFSVNEYFIAKGYADFTVDENTRKNIDNKAFKEIVDYLYELNTFAIKNKKTLFFYVR